MAVEKFFINEGIKEAQLESFLRERFDKAGYSHADIQRTPLGTRIIVYAEKPGLVVGKSGKKINDITQEIKEKFEPIFRFAGVEKFKDMKLKNFSAGMVARLAFALMIQTDPDVLLLDEIFAVGDKDFRPQCLAIFEKYKQEGKTIIFASHSLDTIAEYCDRTILLHEGKIEMFGETKKVLDYYQTI